MKIGISDCNGDLSGRTIKQLLANGFPPGELVVSSTNIERLTGQAPEPFIADLELGEREKAQVRYSTDEQPPY